MAGKKVGIKEVSQEAGVAISTVSHVLNGTASISPQVRARVMDAARRLGYLARRRAKANATALGTVVLAVPDDAMPENEINLFSWTVLSALSRDCERRGVRLMPITGNGSLTARGIVDFVQANSADGVVLINDDRPDLLRGIRASGIPAVLINGEDQDMHIDSVTPGNRFGARLATDWLIKQGHRSILHLTWQGRTTIRRRLDGFLDAGEASGLPMEAFQVFHAEGYAPALGEAAIRTWLDRHDGLGGVTAIFCAADNLALGALRALDGAGLSVPGDVSVMGFDGIVLGELSRPPLTTIKVPLEQIGPQALHLLEQRLITADEPRAAHRLELGCEIAVRGSVGAPA
ncbi:LacI family DNA-binding transcriptional regulator [Consotaella aegiceratis]|uniref:LacI family DNA-binding transcriptional regulator n=1 Tax=Consotaella aegiceratis TaxID=3097961 RepID=UPI002F402B08